MRDVVRLRPCLGRDGAAGGRSSGRRQDRCQWRVRIPSPFDTRSFFRCRAGILAAAQLVKVFELAAARTGLREDEANNAGFKPLTVETTAWDHKAYYPSARVMRIRVTGDTDTGKLLGAQIVGHWRSEVAKRIDIFAAALFHGMSVEDLNDLDLSYTPPLSSLWDPVQMAAQNWCRKVSRP